MLGGGNPLPLVMSQPVSLSAVFAALLATNGVPQWWLAAHGLTNGGWDVAATGDQDDDQVPTWEEWLGDTVPTNAQSFLGLHGIASTSTGMVVRWHGGVLATQYIARASSLNGTQVLWQTIFTNLPPTAVSNAIVDLPASNAPAFYRVQVGGP